MKLVINEGRWALRDNSMIFSNVVWLCKKEDAHLYHLIDEDNNEIPLPKLNTDYIVYEEKDLGK